MVKTVETVKKKARQQQQKRLKRFQERRGNPKTHRGEEKYTQRGKQRLKELSKCIKKCIRDKKRVKRQQLIQRILEDFNGVSNIPGIISAKKKVLIAKIKNERGETITSRKGIVNVFGEFF